jgi:hypothetical protein
MEVNRLDPQVGSVSEVRAGLTEVFECATRQVLCYDRQDVLWKGVKGTDCGVKQLLLLPVLLRLKISHDCSAALQYVALQGGN